jgi:cytochrome P450
VSAARCLFDDGSHIHSFKDPDAFVPERFLGDARYVGDSAIALNPFSLGPRNSIGKK